MKITCLILIQAVAGEESREKRIKGCNEEDESKITEEYSNNSKNTTHNNNIKRETSADTSKDNSKVSEVQKPDYIHVRARRGQATDSHSLAERVCGKFIFFSSLNLSEFGDVKEHICTPSSKLI